MIVVVKNGSGQEKLQNVIQYLEAQGLKLHISEGVERTIIGLVGATQEQKANLNVESLDGVEAMWCTPDKQATTSSGWDSHLKK